MPLRANTNVVARPIGEGAVLVHLGSSRIFELNETGARIWAMLEQGVDRAGICTRLQHEFGAGPEEVESAFDELLNDLTREGLVDV
jgi:hypothetical protein